MIRFLIMDVDGTLTDGKIYMGNKGEALKAFNIKDGYGIHNILPKLDIIPIIITARKSRILSRRCKELEIAELHQGVSNKYAELIKIVQKYAGIADGLDSVLKQCAYIGDDVLDLQCMIPIKEAGGFVGCPGDSVEEVKEIADFVSAKNGGDGAVREFIEWIRKRF